MNLGLLGCRAHGLNHCSVGNLAELVGRTGMGAMGGREEASARGLSGVGLLSGSAWDVGEKA